MPHDCKMVLVVDDEPLIRMFVCDVLVEAGYIAVEAGTGDEALHLLRDGTPFVAVVGGVIVMRRRVAPRPSIRRSKAETTQSTRQKESPAVKPGSRHVTPPGRGVADFRKAHHRFWMPAHAKWSRGSARLLEGWRMLLGSTGRRARFRLRRRCRRKVCQLEARRYAIPTYSTSSNTRLRALALRTWTSRTPADADLMIA